MESKKCQTEQNGMYSTGSRAAKQGVTGWCRANGRAQGRQPVRVRDRQSFRPSGRRRKWFFFLSGRASYRLPAHCWLRCPGSSATWHRRKVADESVRLQRPSSLPPVPTRKGIFLIPRTVLSGAGVAQCCSAASLAYAPFPAVQNI